MVVVILTAAMKFTYFLALIITFSACRQTAETGNANDTSAVGAGPETNPDSSIFNEFAAKKAGTELRLRDWKRTLNLDALGTPRDTSRRILGAGADTHMGSIIEDYTYSGIKLEFFGPPQGQDVWLLSMDLSGNDWETTRGVRIGDTEAILKEKYPEATNEFSGDKNIYRYSASESEIEFNLRNGKIQLIRIYYMIP
jgi:hypothetical protein